MNGHTPGPWVIRPESAIDGGIVIVQQPKPNGGIGYHIGEVWTVSESPENEANARLIAAAPELLEALKECADRLQVHMQHSEDLVAHMKAVAAIAKSTGE